jgi:hypothetical protein
MWEAGVRMGAEDGGMKGEKPLMGELEAWGPVSVRNPWEGDPAGLSGNTGDPRGLLNMLGDMGLPMEPRLDLPMLLNELGMGMGLQLLKLLLGLEL